jgi:cytochrome P450
MRKDPLGLLQRSARECGDISFLRLVFPIYLLAHPRHVERVLIGEHQRKYEKGKLYDRIKPLIGEGLLSSDGEFWRRQRKLAQPAFHRQRLSAFADTMADATEAHLAAWEPLARAGKTIDVSGSMMRLTLRIVGLTLMSKDLLAQAGSVAAALPTALHILNIRFQKLLLLPWVPTPQNLSFNRALGELDGLVGRIIAERRADAGSKADLLEMFISARDDDGKAMNAKQLRDEVMTMLLAGHETTSNALSWTLHLLGRHPDAAERLRQEVDSVLGGRRPSFDDLPNLTYTKMVIEEAMRLYPPVWLLGRRVAIDDEIDGYRIPKGSVVFLSPYVTHRHPAVWREPERFYPERFSPEASAGRPKFSYFPFSGGPRVCLGDRFAMMEMQIILPMIVRRYRLTPDPGHRVEVDPSVTLRPKNGIMMRLGER